MKIKVFQNYYEKLELFDVVDGIIKCVQNGSFLLDEAENFIRQKKYSLAYYLISVSEEEFIKCFLLLHYFTISEKEGIKQFWLYYRNHEPKKRLMLLQKYLMKKITRNYLKSIYYLINQNSFEVIKQNSIYCDCVVPKRFVLPFENFANKDIVDLLKEVKEKSILWQEFVKNKKILHRIISYLKSNKNLTISPTSNFKRLFGKELSNRESKKLNLKLN